ncbi:MAG: hypothetical protein P8101_20050 [Candidatus Thiodiazotropha sp.]
MKSDVVTLLDPLVVLIGKLVGLWHGKYSMIHCISVVTANPRETSEVKVP